MEASTSKMTIEAQAKKAASPLLALLRDSDRAKLIKQGAEAKVYKIEPLMENTSLQGELSEPSKPLLLKYRFPKAYRHATLDKSLTKQRVNHEVKCLIRCMKGGVDVPGVIGVDVANGIILMDWIEGHGSVREVLGGLPEEGETDEENEAERESPMARLDRLQLNEDVIMSSIGEAIGAMHSIDVVHGDLTTSNMLLRRASSMSQASTTTSDLSLPSIALIDFGLSYVSTLIEDKAVDLYVLERALASTHPEDEMRARKEERYIEKVLAAYAKRVGDKEWTKVERRLKDVRLRGRKRSMVG